MFRPLRRTKNAISEEAAKQLLADCKRGVLAVNGDDGYPFAFPIDYYYDRENEKIYFHGAKSGHKVDSLNKSDKVCFTVFGNEHTVEGDWAPYVQSAIVYGRCTAVEDMDLAVEKIRSLALRYYPSAEAVEEEIAKDMSHAQVFEITIEHLCGKQIHEQ